MEGAPKSDKQLSDVKKNVTPHAAFDLTVNELVKKIEGNEQQLEALRQSWLEIGGKDRDKRPKELEKIAKKVKSKSLDVKNLLSQVNANKDLLDHQVEQGEVFASRVYLDGSNMIPSNKKEGKVTGLHSNINFTVGSNDHASYFATTFGDKGGIIIRFALDKRLWRAWKTDKTGPQEKGLGPRAPNTTTTLNDVAQPGVKYEMQEGDAFFKGVVVQGIPAQVTPLAQTKGTWKPSIEDLERTVQRLTKAQRKLDMELEGIDSEKQNVDAEQRQNTTAMEQLRNDWKPGELKSLEGLYMAMNLTKNALHSVRRKKATWK
jgi:hypothetical protein